MTEYWQNDWQNFANTSSANIKFLKTQLHKIAQSGGFLGKPKGLLLTTGLPLIGNVLKPLAKSVLIQLGLTAAASPTDTAIHKKKFGSGFTTLIISNEEMNDTMKIVKFLEEYGLLIKGVSETIKNEAKGQKGGFLEMLLGNLGASSLGNILSGKDAIREGKGAIRAGENFYCRLILEVILKYKDIIKMSLNLMMFIQETIYLK